MTFNLIDKDLLIRKFYILYAIVESGIILFYSIFYDIKEMLNIIFYLYNWTMEDVASRFLEIECFGRIIKINLVKFE